MSSATDDAPGAPEEAHMQSLRLALEAAIDQAGGISSVNATNGVLSEFRAKVERTIARALSDRNARGSTARKIPRELWIQIWCYLSFGDLVAAALVCRSWRVLAHAVPALWTVVDIESSLHHHDCDCGECEGSLTRAGDTNLGVARRALVTLSGNKPVIVQLRSTRSQTNTVWETQLVRILQQCAPRLVELDIGCNDEQLPPTIINGVGAFPVLRSLTIHSIDLWSEEPAPFATSGVTLPALAYLDLDPDCVWPDVDEELTLPSIYRLTSTFHSPHELVAALAACSADRIPELDLNWRLDPRDPHIFDVDPLLPDLLDKIRSLQIINVPTAYEARALKLFARGPREYFALGYLDSKIARGLQACRHLDAEDGLVLQCSLVCDRVMIMISDVYLSEGVEVSFPASARARTAIDWDVVPPALTSIVADAAIWKDVLHGLPAAPRVARITLRIRDASCLDGVRRADGLPAQTFAPGLSLLVDGSSIWRDPVRVSRASVERVRGLLGASTVAVEGIILEDT